jgi:hypothetical protein
MGHHFPLVAMLAFGSWLTAQSAPADDAPVAAALAWLDTIGLPPAAGLRFVEVRTGEWCQVGDEAAQNTTELALLLHDDGSSFRVLTLDLEERSFVRTPAGTAAAEEVGFVERTPQQVAEQLKHGEDEREEHEFWRHRGVPSLSRELRRLVALRVCLANRAVHPAAWLTAMLREKPSLQQRLDAELAHVTWWRIVLQFDDPAVPYPTLLAQVDRYLRHFPDNPHPEEAVATQRVLQRMQSEAASHVAPADLAALPQAERIAEWIYRLRDQDGWQPGQPAFCSVFGNRRVTDSPAHRLCAEGLAAVPALVAAWADDTFTRSVGYHRDFYFSHRVLRIGDAAHQILWAITGVWFPTRAAAEDFARELTTNGEAAALEFAVRNHTSSGAAARLLPLAPQRLLAAVQAVLATQGDNYEKAQLLLIAGGIEGDEAEALLRAHLSNGGGRLRLTAAIALYARDLQQPAVEALVDLWNELSMAGFFSFSPLADQDLQDRVGATLVALGGWRALAAFQKRPRALGRDTIEALGGDLPDIDVWLPGSPAVQRLPTERRLPLPDDASVVALLGALLADRTVLGGERRCDLAASALVNLRPRLLPFDRRAPLAERDRELERLRAATRQ